MQPVETSDLPMMASREMDVSVSPESSSSRKTLDRGVEIVLTPFARLLHRFVVSKAPDAVNSTIMVLTDLAVVLPSRSRSDLCLISSRSRPPADCTPRTAFTVLKGISPNAKIKP
jgi:hypothetical protein